MLETIKSLDESLFLLLNAQHNSFFDSLMWLFSKTLFWVPLYIWFLWILYKRYPKNYWTVLVAIVLMIVASDQLCNLAKMSFMRLRPSQEPHLQALVHIVNGYRGGMYGFYSGHSSNTFTVAFFIITTVAAERKYIIPITLIYAILTSYSRIYLGVHYPGDILTGALIGTLLGTGFAVAHGRLRKRYFKSGDF
ncbi:MAG: phosphatase PAP2 family protein [Lentimicrobiaceae bacterium]|jgi:undecaprenyl-diphosphatase